MFRKNVRVIFPIETPYTRVSGTFIPLPSELTAFLELPFRRKVGTGLNQKPAAIARLPTTRPPVVMVISTA
jgi:hypothetical protein